MWADKNYRILSLIVIFFFLLLYILGANANSSLDAWGYAAQVNCGDDLFQPHHLLYSFLGYLWVSFVNLFFEIDTLLLLKTLNAVFASATLFVLSVLLKILNPKSKTNIMLLILAGSSWGIMRFATENETYIIPLFFSLVGSYFLLVDNKSEKHIVLAGFFAALATLFHQIMFFWWLGLFLGTVFQRKAKSAVLYTLPALIVPLAYSVVTYSKYGTFSVDLLIRFIFSDYFSGTASIEFGGKSLLLLFIGIIRSFVQVHGYIANLLPESYWYWFLGAICFLMVCTGFLLIVSRIKTMRFKGSSTFWVYAIIMLFHLIFALLAGGNSEFLVMLPVLIVIILTFIENINITAFSAIVFGVLAWNIGFGLIPLKFKTLDGSGMVVNHIITNKQEKSAYILYSLPLIENELNYRGIKSDAILLKFTDIQQITIQDSISNLLSKGYKVYTDAFDRPKTLSREYIVLDQSIYITFFEEYNKKPIYSMKTISGIYYLTELVKP